MRWRGVALGMLIFACAGCLNDRPVRSTSFIDRFRGMGGPTGPDAVFIDYVMIERPAGDIEIDRDVWASVDEQSLPAETRALLAENGLRVGIVGGLLPSEINKVVSNPKSVTGHRQRRLYVGNAAALHTNGPVPLAECELKQSIAAEPVLMKYEQAKFAISATPSHASDGRLTIKCVPEIEYQDKKSWLPTGAVGPGWLNNKPVDRCESLSWETTLSPREYLVMGAHFDRGNCLGNQIFGGVQGNHKVQRLLIIRAGRLTPAETGTETPLAAPARDGIVPIAAQASSSVSRGQLP